MSGILIKRFRWEGILKYYGYDCVKALRLLGGWVANNNSMRDHQLHKSIHANKEPDCWLIKPHDFMLSGATHNQKCVYLHLATKRNWLDFEEYGMTGLPIEVVEDFYNIETLKSNPLLVINNETVDMKY